MLASIPCHELMGRVEECATPAVLHGRTMAETWTFHGQRAAAIAYLEWAREATPMGMVAGPGRGGLKSDINTTPLVDVVLVLLIIFMVVTPLQEKEIGVQFPEISQEPSVAPPLEEQVVVGITIQGRFTINGQPVVEEDYIPRLRGILERRATGQRRLFFLPDTQARYERLIAALNGAREAGAETLGMMTKAP
jgi:biopolymer transport protein TolR